MSLNQAIFIEIWDYSTGVCLANRHSIRAARIGKVEVDFAGKKLTLTDVLYVPELNGNLLLIGAASRHGVTVKFGLKSVLFKHNGSVVATANQHSSVYIFRSLSGKVAFKVQAYQNLTMSLALPATAGGDPSASGLAPELDGAVSSHVVGNPATPYATEGLGHTPKNPDSSTQAQSDYLKWHQRFSHAGAHCMQRLKPRVEGITRELHPNEAEKACSTCLHSKMVRVQGKKPMPRATDCLEQVHSDIWGAY